MTPSTVIVVGLLGASVDFSCTLSFDEPLEPGSMLLTVNCVMVPDVCVAVMTAVP